jgi:hypothetical protein
MEEKKFDFEELEKEFPPLAGPRPGGKKLSDITGKNKNEQSKAISIPR